MLTRASLLRGASPPAHCRGRQIGDFGLSQVVSPDQLAYKVCGSWAYAAPEMSKNLGYDCKFDCWSYGVILFVALSGYHPFDPDGRAAIKEVRSVCECVTGSCRSAWLCWCRWDGILGPPGFAGCAVCGLLARPWVVSSPPLLYTALALSIS